MRKDGLSKETMEAAVAFIMDESLGDGPAIAMPTIVNPSAEAHPKERTDRERLDWMGYVGHGFVKGTSFSKWCLESPEEGIRELRQAIDAAMDAEARKHCKS